MHHRLYHHSILFIMQKLPNSKNCILYGQVNTSQPVHSLVLIFSKTVISASLDTKMNRIPLNIFISIPQLYSHSCMKLWFKIAPTGWAFTVIECVNMHRKYLIWMPPEAWMSEPCMQLMCSRDFSCFLLNSTTQMDQVICSTWLRPQKDQKGAENNESFKGLGGFIFCGLTIILLLRW